MAWLDDRVWCHPKINGLSDKAFRSYVNGITYASGMSTHGHLDPATQKLMGANERVRDQLIEAGLWDSNGNGGIVIHDWDEHNGKRDERRAKDRERKRQARQEEDKRER